MTIKLKNNSQSYLIIPLTLLGERGQFSARTEGSNQSAFDSRDPLKIRLASDKNSIQNEAIILLSFN